MIKEYWDSQARKYGKSPTASWGDTYALSLEFKKISAHIRKDDSVLDVGCANGFVLKQLDAKIRVGVDFSEEMIAQADNEDGLTFVVGDARNLNFEDNFFDVVYCVRCLINLPSWDDQIKAIHECLRVAKRKVILSEAFYEPLQRLNAIRQIAGLPLLVEHDFNRYLKQSKLEELLKGKDYFVDDFSSMYYLGSRFIRELVSEEKKYTDMLNTIFYNMSHKYSGGGFGIQIQYVITL